MTSGSAESDELFALRRALWEIAERAQRAIAQFELYVKVRQSMIDSRAADETAHDRDVGRRQSRQAAKVLPPEEVMREALRPGHSREVARALRHIEMNFDKPIGLARLARVAGCSRSTLVRAFQRELGQSAHEYLMGIRLARAAADMASGDKIEVVMLNTGFRSKRNFYRLFKARYGQTPAQFSQLVSEQQKPGGETA